MCHLTNIVTTIPLFHHTICDNYFPMSETNHCGLVTINGDIEIWVNIGLGNGLLPDGTKPLPEPPLIHYLNWSLKVFCGIQLRGISQEVFMNLICDMCSEITLLWSLLVSQGPMSQPHLLKMTLDEKSKYIFLKKQNKTKKERFLQIFYTKSFYVVLWMISQSTMIPNQKVSTVMSPA